MVIQLRTLRRMIKNVIRKKRKDRAIQLCSMLLTPGARKICFDAGKELDEQRFKTFLLWNWEGFNDDDELFYIRLKKYLLGDDTALCLEGYKEGDSDGTPEGT